MCLGYLRRRAQGASSPPTTNSELEELRDVVGSDPVGAQTPVTITTDGAPGLIKAVAGVWPRSLRIRCWFHKRQNLMQQVSPQAWLAFKALVADMQDAPTFEEGQRRFPSWFEQHQDSFPKAYRCLADDAEARLNHLKVPTRHRQCVPRTWPSGRLRRNADGPK